MHSTQQSFLKNDSRQLSVVLLVQLSQRRQNAMRLSGQANVRGLKRLGQLRGFLLGVGNESAIGEYLNLVLAHERNPAVLPLRHRGRFDADGTSRSSLRPKVLNNLFVGHTAIIRHN